MIKIILSWQVWATVRFRSCSNLKAFVSKWLTEKGLTKLCVVFEGMHK